MAGKGLVVSLLGKPIGRLTPTRRGARFSYESEAVREHAGRPLLSLSLPVKARPFSEGLTGSWFRGLLPEGQRLQAVARRIGCDERDYMSILKRIGWECAGAVSIYEDGFSAPAGQAPHALAEAELAEKLVNLPTYGGIDPLARVSLGGYQDKLLVVGSDIVVVDGLIEHAIWWEPDTATASTHIIKPQPENRYAGIVEAEAWAMGVAGHVARCANTAILRPKGAPISLVVERFDRTWHDGKCNRVHQEDCCQAMGIDPSGKYAGYDKVRGTDPTYAKIARLLSTYADDPASEHSELLRQIVANVVLGNVDAHAKNYSLVYRTPGVPELSPLYDVVPVTDVEPRAIHLSLRIGGAILFEEVGRPQLLAEARSWGMPPGDAAATIDETLERLADGLDRQRAIHPDAARRHEPGARRRLDALCG